MSTWIPESERDSRYYIFRVLFKTRVSNIQTMSIDYLQHFGMPSVGDARLDAESTNELVTRMLPISEMAKLHKDGVNIRVVNYADTKLIYEHVTDHLNYWKANLENGFHTRGAPIEDLILLDKFAVSVYAHAKYQFTTEMVDSIVARRMSSTLRVSRENILKKKPQEILVINEETGTTEKQEEVFPERVSMAEIFSGRKALSNGAPKWK